MNEDDREIDDLLARGSLGGPGYDQILKRVLASTETKDGRGTRRRTRWALLSGLILASTIAGWLVFLRPARDNFTPKGSLGATGALDIGCGPSGGRACRAGDTMMFMVNAAVASGVLGAYAERVDDPLRRRIWYFSPEEGSAPTIAPGTGTVVVPQGILIGPEHPPGRYRVTVWLSSRPLSRAEVDGAKPELNRSRAIFEIEVTR